MPDANPVAGIIERSKYAIPVPMSPRSATRTTVDSARFAPPSEGGAVKPDLEAAERDLEADLRGLDVLIEGIQKKNDRNYESIRSINIAIVIAGLALLAVSVIEGAIRGVDEFSALTSGIAVADFVAIFLVNPQSKIKKVLNDFGQSEIIYRTWVSQVRTAFQMLIRSDFSDAQIIQFQNALSRFSQEAVSQIESNVGND